MNEIPTPINLALDLIDTSERREQVELLLNELLPDLAAEIENTLDAQNAIVFYEIYIEQQRPKIRVLLKLKKLAHEFLIHIDSKNSMFLIGTERGGEVASNAQRACAILKTILMKFKA
jgi:hypothetical protein